MDLIETLAIAGPAFDSKESNLVVRVLAREAGRIGVVVHGGKSGKHGMAGVLQPLTLVRMHVKLREGAEAATLAQADVMDAHDGLRGDLDRLALASYLLDLLLDCTEPGAEIHPLFDALQAALAGLERTEEKPPLTAAGHWMMRLLALLGVEPDIDPELLAGSWKRGQSGPRSGAAGEAARKPAFFVLDVAEGMIAAAPGEPGARVKPGAHARPGSDRRVPAWPLEPAAARAVYVNRQTETQRLSDLPVIDPRAAAGWIRALAALATHHLDVRPKSYRYLEQGVVARYSREEA